MPTNKKCKLLILSLIPSQTQGKIVELGAGWGTLAIPLAKAHPQCLIEAYELSPIPYLFLKILTKVFRIPNLKVMRKDFFKADFKGVQGFVCYLYPEAMARLQIKFSKEVSKEAFIVSNTFAIPGWEAKECLTAKDFYLSKIYLYVV